MSSRNHALPSRNPNPFHRPSGTRRAHGCHVFCAECFTRIWLGGAAFKLYLLVAWCIGLTGLMCIQKDSHAMDTTPKMVLGGCILIYLLAQIFGLMAAVSEVVKIFAPYVIILAVVIILNIATLCYSAISLVYRFFVWKRPDQKYYGMDVEFVLLFSAVFLVYNALCQAAVMNLIAKFDKKRLAAERRHREITAHNARIYERLVALQNHEQTTVMVNLDSPPKYSSLDMKLIADSGILESPPPGYSQLRIEEDQAWAGVRHLASARKTKIADPSICETNNSHF